MKINTKLSILFVIITLLIGCTNTENSNKEKVFGEIYKDVSMNNEMKIIEVDSRIDKNDINNIERYFSIENFSNTLIATNSNYNENLMEYDNANKRWIYIENTAKPTSNDDITIPPSNMEGPAYPLIIKPRISGNHNTVNLRVVVTGTINDNSTNPKKVGAFTDIQIVISN